MQTKHNFILHLSDPSATLEAVGGKGLSLSKMIQAGLPVPDGFHITTEAYRQFVAANDLQTKILAALAAVDSSLPATLEAASDSISHLFAESKIPNDLIVAITEAYNELNRKSVAVRSSATAEDLPEASFAGQQETFLNIRGIDALLDAVKKCCASLWTARAIAYRIKNNIDQNTVALAIVVQEMLNAAAAGILFTANPINGRRDEMVINAAWGLGEAIVGGLVSPDTIVADKVTGKVKKVDIAEKNVITVLAESGTREDPLTDARCRSQVINEAQIGELVRIARGIESFYGSPQDIEWCFADSKFLIVQSRPITALPEELAWPLPYPKAVLARGSFAEFVPEPISPLFATLAVPIARESTVKLMSEFGMADEHSYLFEVLNDYVYVGFVFTPKMVWQMIKASFQLLGPIMKTAATRAVAARARFLSTVQRWQARDLAALIPSELLMGVREIFTETALYYNMAQSGTIPTAMISEMVFSAFYKLLVKRKNDPRAETFVFGTENHALRSEKALFDIAMWIKEQPELADFVTRSSAEKICEALYTDPAPTVLMDEFAVRFGAYLREYGHAIYDLDFAKPTPADAPEALVETLKVYLAGKNNPYERQQAALSLREQAETAISNRLDPLRRKYFRRLLERAQETAPLREDSIADMGLGHPQIRRMLGEVGQRLSAAGAIASPEDIYWLEAQELDCLAIRLETGEALTNFEAAVEKRKVKWQTMRRIVPPNTLPRVSWLSKFYASNEQTGDKIKGFAASAGKVTARACVMLGPEDFDKMQPGDVIVAGITTPAWTPLFARASAIVTDIGGPLSHSSIVAREYGIPAVLATGVGTRRLHDGQVITVDGTKGEVILERTAEEQTKRPPSSLEWNLASPHAVGVRVSLTEFVPDAVPPLFATLAVPIASQITSKMMDVVMGSHGEGGYYFEVVNGYVYSCLDTRKILPYFVFGLGATAKILRYGRERRQEVQENSRNTTDKWRKADLAGLTSVELVAGVRELFSLTADYYTVAQSGPIPASTMSEALFSYFYRALVKRKTDPPASALLIGLGNLALQAETSLFDLAQWASGQSTLADYLQQTPAQAIRDALKADPIPVPLAGEFTDRLAAHLASFGHAIYDLDFSKPVAADDPVPVLETLKVYLAGQGYNPHTRLQAQAEKRQQAEQNISARLDPLRRKWFKKLLKSAQECAPDRENAIADLGLPYPQIQRLLRELGRRLVAGGAVTHPEDIYWLEAGEVDAMAAQLDRKGPLANHATCVTARKAQGQRAHQATPPTGIPEKHWFVRLMGHKKPSGNVLKGIGASAGQVTAPACVLREVKDFSQMHPGDVIVAVTTTPAWTPLFAMASAVVTDIGGPLSHSSIVAREYGIPAVMATGVATRRIHTGQVIAVDGGKGTVEILKT
jgi:pyruvate,water dikinase